METDQADPTDQPLRVDEKKAPHYEKPMLTSYGSLARLTRSFAGTGGDAMGAARRMVCL